MGTKADTDGKNDRIHKVWIHTDQTHTEAVSTLVAFNKAGEMMPRYFLYHDLRLKIDHAWRVNIDSAVWLDYVCEVTLIDRIQTVRLSYNVYDRRWMLHLPVSGRGG